MQRDDRLRNRAELGIRTEHNIISYSTTSVISGLFYTHAKYDKKKTRSRRGIWADIPRYAYREILL